MDRELILSLLRSNKFAMLPDPLHAIVELVEDSSKVFSRDTFHQGDGELRSIISSVGEPIEGTNFSSRAGSVGLLTIDGPIMPRSVNTMSSGPSASLEAFGREMKIMEEDPTITSVLLTIDSPGGFVTGTADFASFIRNFSKPVDGFVYGYAASAAYWIGSSVRTLYASISAEVGSIGTVAMFQDTSKRDEKKGVRSFEIVSNLSPNKRLSPESKEGQDGYLKLLDQITGLFVTDVAKGRKTTNENVLATFGQGSMFLAGEAKSLGMIDEITTLTKLVTKLNNVNNPKGINMDINVMEGESAKVVSVNTAPELKSADSKLYNLVLQAGIEQEQERIKSIVSLKEKQPQAASFIDSKLFESGMDKGTMAIAIMEGTEAVIASATNKVVTAGTQLEKNLSAIPNAEGASQDDINQGDKDKQSKSRVTSMVDGAKESFASTHRVEMEG